MNKKKCPYEVYATAFHGGFRYHVYATAFHGGHLISRHRTAEAAEAAARRGRMSDCTCWCTGVIDTASETPGTRRDQDSYPDPYAIGSV